MRRLPVLVSILFGVALATPSSACLDNAVKAFIAAVEGEPVNRGSLRGCRPPNLNQPPPGSGNWPILASSALYLDGAEDSRWLLPWLSGAEGAWGHNGRECGSTIYEGLNWASALAIRHHACEKNDAELCSAAGAWLKAGWAKWALAATPSAPARIEFRQANDVAERNRLGMIGYFGPFAHLVGDRQGEDPSRGDFMGSWVELTAVHPLLAWAADIPARRYKEEHIQAAERSLPLWTAKKLVGKSYSQTLPLDLVGLTAGERETLNAFLIDPTDKDLASQLVGWLATYPSRSRTVTYRRYASGNIVVVASHTTNANKSGATVTAGIGAKSIWLLPS